MAGFAPLLILGTITATIVAELALMPMLRFPAAGFLIGYFILRWPDISVVGRRMLGLAAALGCGALLLSDFPAETLLAALRPGLFLAVFISCVNVLRTAAGQSSFIRRCGGFVVSQPPGRRYAVLSVGSGIAAVVLLFSVLNLFGTMIVQGQERDSPAVRRSVLAMLRGFALTPCISPFALPFAAISTTYADLRWTEVAPLVLAGMVLLWFLGWVEDFLSGRRAAVNQPGRASHDVSWMDCSRMLALIGSLVVAVFGLHSVFGFSLGYGVIFAAPVCGMIWMIVQGRNGGFKSSVAVTFREISAGMVEDRNELAILFAAGVAGVSISHLVPAHKLAHAMDLAAIPPFAIPAAVTAVFVLAGQAAFQPVMIFVIVAAVLPDAHLLGLPPAVLFATYFLSWGLMSVSSPFNVCTLVPARLAGIDSFTLCWRWNAAYWLMAAAVVAGLMSLFTLVL